MKDNNQVFPKMDVFLFMAQNGNNTFGQSAPGSFAYAVFGWACGLRYSHHFK